MSSENYSDNLKIRLRINFKYYIDDKLVFKWHKKSKRINKLAYLNLQYDKIWQTCQERMKQNIRILLYIWYIYNVYIFVNTTKQNIRLTFGYFDSSDRVIIK